MALLAGAVGLALLLVLGCFGNKGYWAVDNCSRIPAGAMPPLNGTYVNAYSEAQANKAEADDFVVYKHEWTLGGVELGPYGRYHIHQMIKRLAKVPFPVVVQPQFDEHLNEVRRQVIVHELRRPASRTPTSALSLPSPRPKACMARRRRPSSAR